MIIKNFFRYLNLGLVGAIFWVFILALPVVAEEEETAPEAADISGVLVIEETADSGEVGVVTNEDASKKAILDEEISAGELDEKAPRVLPDSPWYVFKRLGRTVRSLVTRDPVKKAELKLHYANQQLLEADALSEKGNEEKAEEILGDYGEEMKKIAELGDQLDKHRDEAAPLVDSFLDRAADFTLKHQRLLDKLENQLPEQAFEKVEQAREKSIKHFGEVMEKVAERHDEIKGYLERAIENQAKSEFKDLKNLEVLKRLEEKLPDEAREGMEEVMKKTRERFQGSFEEIPPDLRAEKLKDYFKHQAGNTVQHLEVLENMISEDNLPMELRRPLEAVSQEVMERIKEKAGNNPEVFQKQLEYLSEAKEADKFRFMEELKEGLPMEMKEKMEAVRDEAFSRFHEQFSEDNGRLEKMKEELRDLPELREKFKEKGIELRFFKEQGSEKPIDQGTREFLDKKLDGFPELKREFETVAPKTFKEFEVLKEKYGVDDFSGELKEEKREERKEGEGGQGGILPEPWEPKVNIQKQIEKREKTVQEQEAGVREGVGERFQNIWEQFEERRVESILPPISEPSFRSFPESIPGPAPVFESDPGLSPGFAPGPAPEAGPGPTSASPAPAAGAGGSPQ